MAGRKCTVITLGTKFKIIEDVKGGKPQRLVSDIHSVPNLTVGDIWKGRGNFAKKKRIV